MTHLDVSEFTDVSPYNGGLDFRTGEGRYYLQDEGVEGGEGCGDASQAGVCDEHAWQPQVAQHVYLHSFHATSVAGGVPESLGGVPEWLGAQLPPAPHPRHVL